MPLYKVNIFMPNMVKVNQGYEEVTKYVRPRPIKTIWEWFEKRWDEWIDELACRWLEHQKVIYKILKPREVKEQVEYKSWTIDTHDLVRSIFKYNDEYQCFTGQPVKYILVGRNIHHSLKEQIYLSSFQFPIDAVWGDYKFIFAGCQIVLVPHMEGILFLPDLPDPLRFPYE